MLDALEVEDMRLFINQARSAFSPRPALSPKLPSTVQPSILFPKPVPASNATPFTSSTPKMDRVRSIVSVRAMITVTGSLDFLDSQSSSKSTKLRLSQRENYRFATENTEYLSDKLRAFCQLCHLHIFYDAV